MALNAKLWFVRPMGFRIDDNQVKRSGLDYWNDLDWEAVDDWNSMISRLPVSRMWFVTKFGKQSYCQVNYERGDALVFGSESNGLPPSIREQNGDRSISIPMPGPVRSLNLSVSVGIVSYEAHRQLF